MKALVGAFSQEKALVEAFSMIVKPMDRFTALISIVRGRGGAELSRGGDRETTRGGITAALPEPSTAGMCLR